MKPVSRNSSPLKETRPNFQWSKKMPDFDTFVPIATIRNKFVGTAGFYAERFTRNTG